MIPHDTRLRRHVPLIVLEVLLVGTLIFEIARENGPAVFLLSALVLAALVPLALEPIARASIPMTLQLLYAVLLFGGAFLGTYLHVYGVWTPWDTVVHFFSGILIALGADHAWRILSRRHGFVLPTWLWGLAIVSFSAFIAFLWEVAEFVTDLVSDSNAQVNNVDTMTDMIAGTTSALIVVVVLALTRAGGRTSV